MGELRFFEFLILGAETKKLQLLLLKSFPKKLVPTGIKKVIESTFVSKECPPDKKRRRKRFEPAYSPKHWTFDYRELECNNCYDYANIKKTDNYAQPGGEELTIEKFTAEGVIRLAIGDGLALLPTPADDKPVRKGPKGDSHLVALFVSAKG